MSKFQIGDKVTLNLDKSIRPIDYILVNPSVVFTVIEYFNDTTVRISPLCHVIFTDCSTGVFEYAHIDVLEYDALLVEDTEILL